MAPYHDEVDMTYRHDTLLFVLSGLSLCAVLVLEFGPSLGIAAPPSPPAVPPNVNVVNTPGVNVVNIPTVRVQDHNWQYLALVIPKAFPGTPEWNDFVGQLNGYGQQGWELVNIVETVAFLKKSV